MEGHFKIGGSFPFSAVAMFFCKYIDDNMVDFPHALLAIVWSMFENKVRARVCHSMLILTTVKLPLLACSYLN